MSFGLNQTLPQTSNLTLPDRNDYPPFSTFQRNPMQRFATLIGHHLPLNWIGKRLAAWLRSLLKATAKKPVDVEVLGVRMRLCLKDNACERRLMLTPQFFDPGDLAELRTIIAPGFRFIDIGANVGTYSLYVARHAGEAAKILAIEPHPALSSRLQENAVLNHFDITIVRAAVSDFNGTIEVSVDSSNLGGTTAHKNSKRRGLLRKMIVPCRTLLDVLCDYDFERVDAIKIDVEGLEDRALIPFLEQSPPALWPKLLIVEANESLWQYDLFTELESRGWYCKHNPSAVNCIFIRE